MQNGCIIIPFVFLLALVSAAAAEETNWYRLDNKCVPSSDFPPASAYESIKSMGPRIVDLGVEVDIVYKNQDIFLRYFRNQSACLAAQSAIDKSRKGEEEKERKVLEPYR